MCSHPHTLRTAVLAACLVGSLVQALPTTKGLLGSSKVIIDVQDVGGLEERWFSSVPTVPFGIIDEVSPITFQCGAQFPF